MNIKKAFFLLSTLATIAFSSVSKMEIAYGERLSKLNPQGSQIDKPFLWRVTKGEREFYLFGTIHIGDQRMKKLPKLLDDAITYSDEVRTEIPMNLSTQIQSLRLMSRYDGKRLSEIIPTKLYNEAREYVKEVTGMDTFGMYDTMKVWVAGMLLSFIESSTTQGGLIDIDTLIYDEAKNRAKGVGGIETIEEQASMLDILTHEEQVLLFESSLEYLKTHRDVTKQLIELYIAGDGEKLYSFAMESMSLKPQYKEVNDKAMNLMFEKRNIRMMARIEALSLENPTKVYLFAFGVLHFLGEKSVIDYLQCNGYDVTRVK